MGRQLTANRYLAYTHPLGIYALMIKNQFFSSYVLYRNAIGKCQFAVDECTFYLPVKRMTLQWAPSTFALQDVRIYCPRAIGAHQDEVGLIARTDEASLFDAIEQGRVVAHLLYQCLDGDDAPVHQLQHAVQRELDGGHA